MKTGAVGFFCLPRLAFEIPATYFGMRGLDGLAATYGAAAIGLAPLYPACHWSRSVKATHPPSVLKYL